MIFSLAHARQCSSTLLSLVLLSGTLGLLSPGLALASGEPPATVRAAFGRSILIHENTIFVAEPSGFHEPGQVHVVRQVGSDEWRITQSLNGVDGFVDDRFGSSIAAGGDLLAVAASRAHMGQGAVFVFLRGPDGGYSQIAKLAGPPSVNGFGASVAVVDQTVLVGSAAANDGAGALFAFTSNAGEWLMVAQLDGDEGARLGSSMVTDGEHLAVTAPGLQKVQLVSWNGFEFGTEGAAYWPGDSADSFAASLQLKADRLIVGAPGFQGRGAVVTFARPGSPIAANALDFELMLAELAERPDLANPETGEENAAPETPAIPELPTEPFQTAADAWPFLALTPAPDHLGDRARFGSAVAATSAGVWIGAGGAEDGGEVILMGDEGAILRESGLAARAGFGSSIAASESFVVIGASADAYGEGTAFLYRLIDGEWESLGALYNEIDPMPAIAGSEVQCEDGRADAFSCEGVDLLAFVPNEDMEINRGVRLNDVWGWTDPETGFEYALVGHMEALAVVEVSSPTGPRYLGTLPRTEGSPGSTWRDIKVYRDHAFIVADGAGQHGMQVFDLRQLREISDPPVRFEADALYEGIASSHNIVINEETGFAYAVGNSAGGETCGGGLHMIDIRVPLQPTFVGCFTHSGTNNSGGGATHDAQCISYEGPDLDYSGREICVSSNGAALSVSDVTDKTNPAPVSAATYPNFAYVHQGWFTDDHRYFYQNDEGDEISGVTERTRTMIWDLTDLDDPTMIGEFFGPTDATDHNLYVKGNIMYQTNNASGLRIVDISDPESPVEVGHFDTTPYGNDTAGFNGTWSSYPYFGSGTLVVTSRREGLFLVRKRNIDT